VAHVFGSIQNVASPLVGYGRLGTATSSSNSQRNALNGKCLFKNLKNMNF
jgi:hypothetical protein